MHRILSGLEKTAAAQLVRYAVQRAMFCKQCSAVLDYRRAVLVELVETQHTVRDTAASTSWEQSTGAVDKTLHMLCVCTRCLPKNKRTERAAGLLQALRDNPRVDSALCTLSVVFTTHNSAQRVQEQRSA